MSKHNKLLAAPCCRESVSLQSRRHQSRRQQASKTEDSRTFIITGLRRSQSSPIRCGFTSKNQDYGPGGNKAILGRTTDIVTSVQGAKNQSHVKTGSPDPASTASPCFSDSTHSNISGIKQQPANTAPPHSRLHSWTCAARILSSTGCLFLHWACGC